MLALLFVAIFIVSVLWALWSLRDLKTPQNIVPKFEKKVRKVLFGVIHLPKG